MKRYFLAIDKKNEICNNSNRKQKTNEKKFNFVHEFALQQKE